MDLQKSFGSSFGSSRPRPGRSHCFGPLGDMLEGNSREANCSPYGPEAREKEEGERIPKSSLKPYPEVRSKRINLEGNTHAQEINVSQLPV
jgi:hypothetical protein